MIQIYLDETGDNGLKIQPGKTERWFLIAAILVESIHVESLTSELERLAAKYFHSNEIKSSKSSSTEIRTNFLNELPKDIWRGVILQVDKPLLDPESFKWKPTFYKRVPRQLYNYLLSANSDAVIYPDPIGEKPFQESLKKYFEAHAPIDLFSEERIRFIFSSSKTNRINQLADYCSGTKFRDLRDGSTLFNIIAHRFSIRKWPLLHTETDTSEIVLSKKVEKPLFDASVGLAKAFINKHADSDDPIRMDQTTLAMVLLDEVVNGDPLRYIPLRHLIQELSVRRGQNVGDYYLRTKVIGKLRMNDVMIVSNRKGGYKLPVTYSEVEEYFKNMSEKVEPMMAKAEAVSQHIFTVLGKDVFSDPRWSCLRKQKES